MKEPLPPLLDRNISGSGCFLFYLGVTWVAIIAAIASRHGWEQDAIVQAAILMLVSLWGLTLVVNSLREPQKKRHFVIRLPGFIIVGCVAAFVLMIQLPNLIQPRHRSGGESAAIGALKTIGAAQSLFREADKEGDGNLDYGTRRELGEAGTTGLIDALLASGTKQGYLFEVSYGATTSEFLWIATANPALPTTTGDRYFVTNHEGLTFYTVQRPFLLNTVDCTIPKGVSRVGR